MRKLDTRVRRSEATPDKLAYREVERRRQAQREQHQPGQDDGVPLDSDQVEIHNSRDKASTKREEGAVSPPPPERRHIDTSG